jgi:hypothetical protein
VLIRYEGPKGGPGMQEMLYPTSYLKSKGLGKACALITDGRFSGGTSGLSIGHARRRRPRAAPSAWSKKATPSRSTSPGNPLGPLPALCACAKACLIGQTAPIGTIGGREHEAACSEEGKGDALLTPFRFGRSTERR